MRFVILGQKPARLRLGLLSVVLAFGLVACGQDEPPAAEPPTDRVEATEQATEQTPVETTVEATIAEREPAEPGPVDPLRDVNLLDAAGAVGHCDAGSGADIDIDTLLQCENPSTAPTLAMDIDAGSFARWSLQWGDAPAPLSGTETLALVLEHRGGLRPNLYLVEEDGARMHVALARYGFGEGEQTLYIPLREIRDDEGNRLDFSRVNEVQLVFEWADMAGELTVHDVRFAALWTEPVSVDARAEELAQALTVPAGFAAAPVVQGLGQMTQIDFTPAGDMLVSLQGGRIWWYEDSTGDGLYDQRRLYTTGFTEVVGLLYDPVDGAIWIGGRGQLYRTLDSSSDGVADTFELRIDGLPWGRHQNNGLVWNPEPDPFSGEPEHTWIYFPLGSTGDLEVGGPYNATVLRFPRTGQGQDDLEIVAEGLRNPYNVLFAHVPVDLDDPDGPRAWQLFSGENGPDYISEPDEVNHIRWGHHYGFPAHFGDLENPAQEGDPYSGPVYEVTPHASANGLAYINNPTWPDEYRTLYVSLFGEVFSPTPVGHTVERVMLTQVETPDGELTYRGAPDDFVVGLDRPLPLVVDPGGDMLVGDYATGVIYRIYYAGAEAASEPAASEPANDESEQDVPETDVPAEDEPEEDEPAEDSD